MVFKYNLYKKSHNIQHFSRRVDSLIPHKRSSTLMIGYWLLWHPFWSFFVEGLLIFLWQPSAIRKKNGDLRRWAQRSPDCLTYFFEEEICDKVNAYISVNATFFPVFDFTMMTCSIILFSHFNLATLSLSRLGKMKTGDITSHFVSVCHAFDVVRFHCCSSPFFGSWDLLNHMRVIRTF